MLNTPTKMFEHGEQVEHAGESAGLADVVGHRGHAVQRRRAGLDRSSFVPTRWPTMLTGLSTLTMPCIDSHDTGTMSVTELTAEPTTP